MDHIQARPHAFADPPASAASGESVDEHPDWSVPILMGLLHLVVWLPGLGAFLVFGQRFKKIFADFQMKLPWPTELAIAISDVLSAWSILPLLLLLTLLAADILFLFWLYRRRTRRLLAWIWFVLAALLGLAILLWVQVALFGPLVELMDGLSR